MREQAPEPRIVAQHGVEGEMRHFKTFRIDQPCGVGFRADRLPDFFVQIVGGRLAGGVTQHHAEHVGFDAGVEEPRARRRDPPIELRDAADGAFVGAKCQHHVDPQPIEVASVVLILSELDAGGHMQQVADRRPAIFGALESRHIGLRRIVDRFDRAFGNGDADQHSRDRFHHRLRNQPVAIGPSVLIMLEQNPVVLGDQQTGDRIARQIVGSPTNDCPCTSSGCPPASA